MSKKLPLKPEGYDKFLGDLVDTIRQHQAMAGGKAMPKPILTKNSVAMKPSAKKRKGGQS